MLNVNLTHDYWQLQQENAEDMSCTAPKGQASGQCFNKDLDDRTRDVYLQALQMTPCKNV